MRYNPDWHGSRASWLWNEFVVLPFIHWRRIGRGLFWLAVDQSPCSSCCRRIESRFAKAGETRCADCRKLFALSMMETWLREAIELHPHDEDGAIDIVYNNLDGELTAGHFLEIDELLSHCVRTVDTLPTEILLGILTLTSHAPPDSFSHRRALVDVTRDVLVERMEWEPDVLKGLE
jgi:hypothetical protein